MNRRTLLGMLAGMVGIASVGEAKAEPYGQWVCAGELKMVQDSDWMTCTLMQKWVHSRTGAVEWRTVPIEELPC